MENKKEFVINFLYIAIIALIAYLCYKFLLPPLVPFIIGLCISYFSIKLCNKLFIKDTKTQRAICLAIIYLIIIVVAVLLAILGINKIVDFFVSVPKLYTSYVEPSLSSIEKMLYELNAELPIEVKDVFNESIEGIFDAIKSLVTTVSTALVSSLTSIITNTPNFLISVIVVVISSTYFSFDYQDISAFFKRTLPSKVYDYLTEIKAFCESNLFNVLKTYLILMLITMIELFVGFIIFGIPNAGILAMLISIVDILPILGIGTVLIPWGIIALVIGKTAIGIEILVLYLIMTIIRNILESRMVGGELDLHPLATLVAMIIGLYLFGILGMLGLPLVLSFFVKRSKQETK